MTLSGTRIVAERLCKFLKGGTQSDIFWAAEPFHTGTYDILNVKHPETIDPQTDKVQLPRIGRLGYHFHALINTPFHKMEIFDWYYPRYRGRTQIIANVNPEIKQAASWYLTKYVTKEITDYDFHFSDNIRNRQQLRM